jgi:tetratricopeptide (TPR) repeat protein
MEKSYNSIYDFIEKTFPYEFKKMQRDNATDIDNPKDDADRHFSQKLEKIIKRKNGSGKVCPKCKKEISGNPYGICEHCGENMGIYVHGYDIDELPQEKISLLSKIYDYSSEDDYKNTIKECTKAITKYPDFAEAYNARAMAYIKIREYDHAFADIKKALEFIPQNADYLDTRGLIYWYSDKNDKALADYNQALSIDLNDQEKYYNRGRLLLEQKEYADAIKDFMKAIELSPDYFDAHRNLADAYSGIKNYDKAMEEYDWLGEQTPNSPFFYRNRADVYLAMNEVEKGLSDLEKAITLFDPDDDAFEIQKCQEKLDNLQKDRQGKKGNGSKKGKAK